MCNQLTEKGSITWQRQLHGSHQLYYGGAKPLHLTPPWAVAVPITDPSVLGQRLSVIAEKATSIVSLVPAKKSPTSALVFQ